MRYAVVIEDTGANFSAYVPDLLARHPGYDAANGTATRRSARRSDTRHALTK